MFYQPGVFGVDRLAEFAGGCDDVLVLGQRQQSKGDGPTGLAAAQHISFAALPEIQVGQFEAVQCARDRLQSFAGVGSLRQPRREEAEAGMDAASDAATQLMSLRGVDTG